MIKKCAALCYNGYMIKAVNCPALSAALESLKKIIAENERSGKKTVIFCEDRLTLAAERTVCAAVEGTFSVSVYTFARFLVAERGKKDNLLSSQGSAMAIRRIIEENRDKLSLFSGLSAAAAASSVYATIALLYSSGISAQDISLPVSGGLLKSKLKDISVIYSEYEKYLSENGKIDRNYYISSVSDVIRSSARIAESEVVFLGFQSFTGSTLECVKAAFSTARSVYGLFIGGDEQIYTNEARLAFIKAAESFGGCVLETEPGGLIREAEILRRGLFDAESFCSSTGEPAGNVHIYEASDGDDELEFIAASIKKQVIDGKERYGKISVMLPDVAGAERDLKRVFSQYAIPYYADRRRALSEHALSEFIFSYLECAASGCRHSDCDAVIASPLFPATRADKDIYRNFALRLANFRGGVKREPKPEILQAMKFDYDAVQRVRQPFLKGLACIAQKCNTPDICAGLRKIFKLFAIKDKLAEIAEKFKNSRPAEAEFTLRVYDAAENVLSEAESIAGGANMPVREIIKILKSGFAALEISIIPPKADAVFVGDLSGTANTGSNVVFAARLTGDVPAVSADCALLSDREIAELEKLQLDVSPKIRQVNMRLRETTALNLCAFKKKLYLSYPARLGQDEATPSEIISYVKAIFRRVDGGELEVITPEKISKSRGAFSFYCSEPLPALKKLLSSFTPPEAAAAVLNVLKDSGYTAQAQGALSPKTRKPISCGKRLYGGLYGSVSPTALESYFSCPYRGFMQRGLALQEREEGSVRPVDTGNFIHKVLELCAAEANGIGDGETLRARAKSIAEELLKVSPYSSLADSKSGKYTAANLISEAQAVCSGMFEQLKNSKFEIKQAETPCEVSLGSLRIYGRIDRVDECGDMVRIIDYKSGAYDVSASKYYMGLKLQLPLYLLSAAKGKRAVGAYYFPASVEYKDKQDGVFRLQGFMDGSEEVVSSSDVTLENGKKSRYFEATLGGRKNDAAMDSGDFTDFLKYSALVSEQGAREMTSGNISPSPAPEACRFCKMGGSCGFAVGRDGAEREEVKIKCRDIAEIVRGGED